MKYAIGIGIALAAGALVYWRSRHDGLDDDWRHARDKVGDMANDVNTTVEREVYADSH